MSPVLAFALLAAPVPDGCASLGELCARLGARLDPSLANECVWTQNVGGDGGLRSNLAKLVRGRWSQEGEALWLRPDAVARAAWDRAAEDQDDARFKAAASAVRPPSVRDLQQAYDFSKSVLEDATLAVRVGKLQRLVTLLSNNPEMGQALDDAHLGRLGEGQSRIYGAGGQAMPRRLFLSLRTVQERVEPFSPQPVETRVRDQERVVVTRARNAYSFDARLADGTKAFAMVSLLPHPAGASPSFPLRLKPASRLMLRAYKGERLTDDERRSLEEAAREPLRLLASEALDAEFAKERRPTLVLLADDRLQEVLEWGGSSAPRLGTDYRREESGGWLRVAPARLRESTRLRTDRTSLRALLRQRSASSAVGLRDACKSAVMLAADFDHSAAAPVLRALWPEVHRFFRENDWRWVRTIGALSDRAFAEAAVGPLDLDRLTWPEKGPLAAFYGTVPAQGRLAVETSSNEVFMVDAAQAAARTGIGHAASDLTPEAFGAYLKRVSASGEAALDADQFRTERLTARVVTSVGETTGTVVLRRPMGRVVGGDLSRLGATMRERVQKGQS